MKVSQGEYLTCKYTSSELGIEKGKRYRVNEIYHYTIVDYRKHMYVFQCLIGNCLIIDQDLDFYFYTKQEERKLKLKVFQNEST
jgi:hypothetical protein